MFASPFSLLALNVVDSVLLKDEISLVYSKPPASMLATNCNPSSTMVPKIHKVKMMVEITLKKKKNREFWRDLDLHILFFFIIDLNLSTQMLMTEKMTKQPLRFFWQDRSYTRHSGSIDDQDLSLSCTNVDEETSQLYNSEPWL